MRPRILIRALRTGTPPGGGLERAVLATPPSAGAIVMATGIVSIAMSLAGARTPARVLLGLAAFAWVAVGLLLTGRAMRQRWRISAVRSPAVLSAVAATDVLGAALLTQGRAAPAAVLLVIALLLWIVLLPAALRASAGPTVGMSFMLTVSTESLAVLAAALAARRHEPWLLVAACIPFLLGLAAYARTLARFDMGQLRTGRGDHWVSGGALAIAALAAGQITSSAEELHRLGSADGALRVVCFALWALAAAWLPPLVLAEVRWPRLSYDVRRWSSVFPVGMYATCSFIIAEATGTHTMAQLARPAAWLGLGVWLAVCVAMLRRALAQAGRRRSLERAGPGYFNRITSNELETQAHGGADTAARSGGARAPNDQIGACGGTRADGGTHADGGPQEPGAAVKPRVDAQMRVLEAPLRRETELERYDRNLTELLGELRVALPGVQVLFAFLLVAPFNQRFGHVSAFERGLYLATLLLTLLASILLMAPTIIHRLHFGRGEKPYVVHIANRLMIAGLAVFAVAMTCAVMLVTHYLFDTATSIITTAAVVAGFVLVWYALPMHNRRGARRRV